jgi:hypothetical protein
MTATAVLSPAARLSKLRAMSAAEIVYRLRYSAVIAIERRQFRAHRLTPADRLNKALRADFRNTEWKQQLVASRRANRPRFFCSVSEPDSMRSLFATAYEEEWGATLAQAGRVRRHQFEFFGQHFNCGDAIEWQRDPVSGRRWPPLYHADVPVHGGDAGYGDVKYVWELNRQQFLIDLGKAWFLGRDREDLDALQQLVRSWIAGNPYAAGVNWSCALEPAFRVFSWLWAYFLTVEDLEEQFHLEWLRGFYDHARFIERHLELYSSPYNHLIAEAAALYMLGTCFPEFRDAEGWRATGKAVLETSLAEQFYADGGSVEQSTFYHHATVGFYILAAVLARRTGNDLSRNVWNTIERGLDFSMMLSQPDGKTPSIGGGDDGKPIRMEHLPFWDFRPYQAIGAVLFNRPDFKRFAGRFHEDALWLLGPAGLAQFEALESHTPRETSVSLVSSGYYVMRSNWSERADYVCFDCGEQAAGIRTDGVPNSMHGHADCLSVIAWLNGRRVLVDSGLYAYNIGGAWEAHFRETAAHNTATVDRRDQATHIGKMAWSHSYRGIPEGWKADGQQAWVVGSHDGYARGACGVVHRRAVWLRPESYLLIYDEFVGTGNHELTVHYQFAPGALEHSGPHSAVFEGSVDMLWAGSEAWTSIIACGGPGPEDGWIAPSLGIRQPAPRVTLKCTTAQPRVTLLTVVAARITSETRVSMVAAGHSTLALVCGRDYVDSIAAAGIAPSHPIDTDALLAVCRVGRDGSVETGRIGGSRIAMDATAVRRLRAPGLHAVTVQ